MERGQTEAGVQPFHQTLTVRNAESDNFCYTISQTPMKSFINTVRPMYANWIESGFEALWFILYLIIDHPWSCPYLLYEASRIQIINYRFAPIA